MFTASAKRKENIAEYMLYMWHIEDLIRANGLDMERIKKAVICNYASLSDNERKELTDWYESLVDMMRRENCQETGHLQLNKNTLLQIDELHRTLMASPKFQNYHSEFYKTLPFIVELRSRQGDKLLGEIETCMTALYGMLMLRLQGREIGQETKDALQQIARFMALLSHYWQLDQDNKLFENADDDPRNG
ncbi:DUF4924 family protein [uncultured Muribaculum sp.]|uniref:DUF4924 family protein n=1 Tax=uncultured Muribaculum sp. TaxID=1918613 RepID=UPI00266ED52A|nr:DUF4924 family protein [uncultured Muribaculum sp.]